MKKMFVSLLCAAAIGSAQDWAKAQLDKSPRHHEWVTVKHDGRSVETFVAYPETSRKTPVILMIHEIYGMTDWVQDMADQLASAGYIVVAPDLLSDMGPNGAGSRSFDQQGAVQAVSHLDAGQITGDLNAIADTALKFPSANGQLFVVGFCWGGGQSFRFAANRSDLGAAFVFYGPPPAKEAMAKIKAPVYGFYAGEDARIGATIPQAKLDMKAAGKEYEPVSYEGAGHGFMRAGEAPGASAENAKARQDALERLKKLLAEHTK